MLIKTILTILVIFVTSIWIAKGNPSEKAKVAFVGLFFFFGVIVATSMLYDLFVQLLANLTAQ